MAWATSLIIHSTVHIIAIATSTCLTIVIISFLIHKSYEVFVTNIVTTNITATVI